MHSKKFVRITFTLFFMMVLISAETIFAQKGNNDTQNKKHYILINGGIYTPTDDLDDFKAGFYGEISVNRYISPYFVIDAALGYFQTSYSENGIIFDAPYSGDFDIYAIPVSVSAKGIIQFDVCEIYAGGGTGFYFVQGDLDLDVTNLGKVSINDSGNTWGFHLLAGITFDLTETVFLGVGGKYLFTGDVELEENINGIKVKTDRFDVDGFMVTALVGFRF